MATILTISKYLENCLSDLFLKAFCVPKQVKIPYDHSITPVISCVVLATNFREVMYTVFLLYSQVIVFYAQLILNSDLY